MNYSNAIVTEHALLQMTKRDITVQEIESILDHPEEIHTVRVGRIVLQGMVSTHLLRIVIDVDRKPPEVVTAYKTSKINKYRSNR